VLAVVLAAAATAGGVLLWSESQVPSYEVPNLVGRQEAEINALVGGNGWKIERREGREDGTVRGQILAQDPAPGTQLEEGDTLVVTVSLGATLAAPPTDLVGLTRDEAIARIQAAGFVEGDIAEDYSEDVAAGVVLSVPELPAELEKGSPIGFVVSAGPEPRTIPDGFGGQSFDEVAAALDGLGLVAVRVENSSETVEEGLVIGTDPPAGSQVERGREVQVIVSTGPPMVEVPDVSGRSSAEAADALEAAGLVVAGTRGPPNQPVRGTDPQAGTSVRRGSEVTIVTGRDNDNNDGPGNDD
jgi:serine/threonine-protein kinase